MACFFIRVAGDTSHNNPDEFNSYVENEPPIYPQTYFNYKDDCLKKGFVRIGWPDVGDISKGGKYGSLTDSYSLESYALKPHIKKYLLDFSQVPLKSIILMPDKDNPGDLYIGEVSSLYKYLHDVPNEQYECAHRLGVNWDKEIDGNPKLYKASELSIGIVGGWWMRAFHEIKNVKITRALDKARS